MLGLNLHIMEQSRVLCDDVKLERNLKSTFLLTHGCDRETHTNKTNSFAPA
jgi:hypothetical protein